MIIIIMIIIIIIIIIIIMIIAVSEPRRTLGCLGIRGDPETVRSLWLKTWTVLFFEGVLASSVPSTRRTAMTWLRLGMLLASLHVWSDAPFAPAADVGGAETPRSNTTATWMERVGNWTQKGRQEASELWTWATGATRDTPLPTIAAVEQSWLAWTCDSVLGTTFNWIGWGLFGANWHGVRTMGARFLGIGMLVGVLVGLHTVLTVCWPVLEIMGWVLSSALWLLRVGTTPRREEWGPCVHVGIVRA